MYTLPFRLTLRQSGHRFLTAVRTCIKRIWEETFEVAACDGMIDGTGRTGGLRKIGRGTIKGRNRAKSIVFLVSTRDKPGVGQLVDT